MKIISRSFAITLCSLTLGYGQLREFDTTNFTSLFDNGLGTITDFAQIGGIPNTVDPIDPILGIPIVSPPSIGFNLNLGAINYVEGVDTAFVNGVGALSFGSTLPVQPVRDTVRATQVIAPFYGNFDLFQSLTSQSVLFGQSVVDGNSAFVINYNNIQTEDNTFSINDSETNTFQLVLIDQSGVDGNNDGDFIIEFNYGFIGTASDSFVDFDNSTDFAFVGVSDGQTSPECDSAFVDDGVVCEVFNEVTGSFEQGAFIAGGENDLTEFTNVGEPGTIRLEVIDGEIIDPGIVFVDFTVDEVDTVFTPLSDEQFADGSNALATGLLAYTNFSAVDVNSRLLNYRSGALQAERSSSSYRSENSQNPSSSLSFDVFGNYNYYTQSNDSRIVEGTAFSEVDTDVNTGVVGVEAVLGNFRVGIAGLFSDGTVESGAFDFDVDSAGGAAYLSAFFNDVIGKHDVYFDVLYNSSTGDYDASRTTSTTSGLVNVGDAEFDQDELTLNVGIVFNTGSVKHGPFVQYSDSSVTIDGFEDTGNSVAVLFQDSSFDSRNLLTGYQASFITNSALTPQIRVAYEQELEDENAFLPEEAIVVGGGVVYNPGYGLIGTLDTEYRTFENEATSFSFSLGLSYAF